MLGNDGVEHNWNDRQVSNSDALVLITSIRQIMILFVKFLCVLFSRRLHDHCAVGVWIVSKTRVKMIF